MLIIIFKRPASIHATCTCDTGRRFRHSWRIRQVRRGLRRNSAGTAASRYSPACSHRSQSTRASSYRRRWAGGSRSSLPSVTMLTALSLQLLLSLKHKAVLAICYTLLLSLKHKAVLTICYTLLLSLKHKAVLAICKTLLLSLNHKAVLTICYTLLLSLKHKAVLTICYTLLLSLKHKAVLAICKTLLLSLKHKAVFGL